MPVRAKVKTKKPKKFKYVLVNAFGAKHKRGSLLLAAQQECRRKAREMAQELRTRIYRQMFRHKPLSRNYLQHKIRNRLDKRILIATKKYVRAIGVIDTAYGARVGLIKRVRQHKGRTIPYKKLQRWLEYGVPGLVPARPHWRPMMRKWKKDRKAMGFQIKNKIGKDLRKKLRASR